MRNSCEHNRSARESVLPVERICKRNRARARNTWVRGESMGGGIEGKSVARALARSLAKKEEWKSELCELHTNMFISSYRLKSMLREWNFFFSLLFFIIILTWLTPSPHHRASAELRKENV